MKKHVFLIQVHKEPELVGRILRKLSSSNHYFFLNIDKKVSQEEYPRFIEILKGIPNVYLTKRFNVMHGGYSQIACTLYQMEEAYSKVPDFNYIHTISGQCYPCVTREEFDAFFEKNEKSYSMQDSLEDRQRWLNNKYAKRVEHWYLNDIFNAPWTRRIHLAGIVNLFTYFIPRRFQYFENLWGRLSEN